MVTVADGGPRRGAHHPPDEAFHGLSYAETIAYPQADGWSVPVRVVLQGGVDLTAGNFTFMETPDDPPTGNYRQYLLPLRTQDLGGQNGSLWKTELTVFNGSTYQVEVVADDCDARIIHVLRCPTGIPVAPSTSSTVQVTDYRAGNEGTFLYVPLPIDDDVEFELRVRDVSRAAEGLGTEIPIVRVDDFQGTIRLLDVPTDPRYRSMLRIYGQEYLDGTVLMTVYPMSGQTPIETREITLSDRGTPSDPVLNPYGPDFLRSGPFARLDPITDAVRASG
jgi:hypothetical protein